MPGTIWNDVFNSGGESSSGILGALQYSNGLGGFTSDETKLFWDSINNVLNIQGDVLISNSEKYASLTSAASESANLIQLSAIDDVILGDSSSKTRSIVAFANGSRMFDIAFGRVGISNPFPNGKLHVKGTANEPVGIFQAASVQTNDIFQIRDSVSADLLKINSSGELDLISEVSGVIWSNKAGSIGYGGTANNELIFKNNGIDSFKITTNGSLRMLRSLELPFGTSYTVFGSGAASQHSGLQFNPISGANGTIKTVGTNSSGNPIDIAHFWVSGDLRIDGELNHDGVSVGFYGASPVAQYSPTQLTSDFVAGSGASVNVDSTFDGMTIRDIVQCIKRLGLST